MTNAFSVLQTACSRQDVSVVNLVRAAVVVATAIKDEPALKKFRMELSGYDPMVDVDKALPEYRKGHSRIMATDRLGQDVPVYFPDSKGDRLSVVPIIQPLGGIEALLREDGRGAYQVDFSPETQGGLLKAMPGAVRVFRVMQELQFRSVVEAVRQAVFDWALSHGGSGTAVAVDLQGLIPAAAGAHPLDPPPMVAAAGVHISANNSAVTVHSPGATTGQHSGIDGADLQAFIALLDTALKASSTANGLESLHAARDELNALAAMQPPKASWLRESLSALRGTLENAAGSVVGTLAMRPELIAALSRLLGT